MPRRFDVENHHPLDAETQIRSLRERVRLSRCTQKRDRTNGSGLFAF